MRKLDYGEVIEVSVDDYLKVNIMRADVGYVIDLYTAKDDIFVNTVTVWDDDIESVLHETESILDTEEDYEEEEI